MATGPLTFNRSSKPDGSSIALAVLALLSVIVISIIAFSASYWLGFAFLSVGILIWLLLGVHKPEIRGPLLVVYFFLLAVAFIASIVQSVLGASLVQGQSTVVTSALGPSLSSYEGTLIFSIIIGIVGAVLLLGVPLLIMAMLAASLYKNSNLSAWEATRHLIWSLLGISRFSLEVEGREIKGSDEDKELLSLFGGPGILKVHPGQVVVLHRHGRITRIIEPGSIMLKRGEKVKIVMPLIPRGNVNKIERVLTQDRVPVTVHIVHVAQVESAKDTRKRLDMLRVPDPDKKQEDLDKDKETIEKLEAIIQTPLVSDDYGQCYEGIIRAAAMAVKDDIWEAHKTRIEGNVRDIFMSCRLDELFQMEPDTGADPAIDVHGRTNERKILAIEKAIFENQKASKLGDGIALLVIDITEVDFPDQIKKKIEEEASSILDARIRVAEAKAQKEAAQHAYQAVRYEAGAIKERARAEVDAEALREDLKIKATTEYYRRVINTLRGERVSDETIEKILQGMAASASIEDEFKRLLQAMREKAGTTIIRSLSEGSG